MFKKIKHFFAEYRQFGFVILVVVLALGLTLSGRAKIANFLLAITAIGNAIPLVWGMIQDIRRGTYGVDILAATAIITSVIMGEYWAGMIIVLMLTGGEALEDYAEVRAKTELTALIDNAPKQAHVLKGHKTIDVAVSKVKINDKIIIKPGDVVPVDCVVLEGESSFDESSLTGESLPVSKKAGEELLSGSINIEGSITAKALRVASESQYGQIIKLVKAAASSQSPFVRMADRYSIPFTIIAFLIAGSAWALSGESIRFLQVLVVATPCPLILAAPIALISGMSRAAKHGVIIKTGGSLEQLAAVKTIAFDKTGTLTEGRPQVDTIKTYGSFTKQEVLGFAAALEQNSNHILAKTMVEAATAQKIKIEKARGVKEISGNGLVGTVKKQVVMVGKESFVQDQGVSIPKSVSTVAQTTSFVVINNKLAGIIAFKDEIRPESKRTLQKLKELGIGNFLMVTGDNRVTAKAIAKQLGINNVKAECLPADKLITIENIQDRPVAFVGDGVNDAPVLTASDVGIALGARGSTAASESANVVIMKDDLNRVWQSVEIAKRTFKIARQSILVGIFISIGLMFIFATGRFAPIYGAALQEIVDVIVIINALRAHSAGVRKLAK